MEYLIYRGKVMTFIQLPDGRKSKLNLPLTAGFPMPFPIFPMPFPVFPMLFPFFPSTKSAFLCAFGVWNPYFRPFRAQNCGFCAFLAFGTLVFGLFEHKIEVFVRFWLPEPPILGRFEHKIGVFVLVCGKRGNWKTQFCHKKHIRGVVLPQEAP